MTIIFEDRIDAGECLARALRPFVREPSTLALGLPRGGAVIADEVARRLHIPWDVFISQRLEAPWDSDLAIGAVTELGTVALNENLLKDFSVPGAYLEHALKCQGFLAQARCSLFRGDRHLSPVEGRTVLILDDGAVTGTTILAAVKALRTLRPARLIAAVPVAARQAAAAIEPSVDRLIVLSSPPEVKSIGALYHKFEMVPDQAVIDRLSRRRVFAQRN